MSFLGGYKWETNPGLDPAMGALTGAYDEAAHTKSRGSKFANNILGGLMKGDTSAIGNPFQAQLGAQNREVDASMDPFLPPEVAAARANLQKNRNQEQAGINFENYVRGSAANAMDMSQRRKEFIAQQRAQLAEAMANAQLGGHQGHETQGWGNLLMSGIGAAGGLLTGIGAL